MTVLNIFVNTSTCPVKLSLLPSRRPELLLLAVLVSAIANVVREVRAVKAVREANAALSLNLMIKSLQALSVTSLLASTVKVVLPVRVSPVVAVVNADPSAEVTVASVVNANSVIALVVIVASVVVGVTAVVVKTTEGKEEVKAEEALLAAVAVLEVIVKALPVPAMVVAVNKSRV